MESKEEEKKATNYPQELILTESREQIGGCQRKGVGKWGRGSKGANFHYKKKIHPGDVMYSMVVILTMLYCIFESF